MLSDYCACDDNERLDERSSRRLSHQTFINTRPSQEASRQNFRARPPPFVRYHRHSFSSHEPFAGAFKSASPQIPPPSTASSSISPYPDDPVSRADPWTKTGWTVSFIRQLFDNLAMWDYLPLCLFCNSHFLQDYHAGRNRYCSSALVYALLALAYRRTFEGGSQSECPPQGGRVCCSSVFFEEAESIVLRNDSSGKSLPDIQALGILAIYQISYGRNAEAFQLIETFKTAATDFCLQEPLIGPTEEFYGVVRATTYCGAVSLSRYVVSFAESCSYPLRC